MSQRTWDTIIPSSTSGNQLATYLNELAAAVDSNNKGTSRPATLDAGGFWIDSTDEATPDFLWYLKCWTGSIDITLMTINISTGAISLQGADGQFQITKTSADSVGPLLKFIKERVAANGQTLIGDSLGEVQFYSAGDDNSNALSAKIKVVASDDATATEAGAYFVFEAITEGGVALAEWMRLKDGNLAIGLVTAAEKLHIKGNFKLENETDAVSGSVIRVRKKRVSGGGQVLLSDILGQVEYQSTTSAGAEVQEAATVTVTATENHSNTNQGTKISIGIKKIGTSVNTEKVVIGENIELKEKTILDLADATILATGSQDIATAASITALSNAKSTVRFTGATTTSLKGITAPTVSQNVVLHNASSAVITIENEDAGATAANRFTLTAAIQINPNESAEVFYDLTAARWKVKSGSGGGVSNSVSDSLSLTGGGSVTIDLTKGLQTIRVAGSGGVSLANAALGASAPNKDGAIIYLVGNSDSDTVTVPQSDVAKGVFMDGDVTLTKGKVIGLMWINSLDRYVRI